MYFRSTLGAAPVDDWLGERLPVVLPWWAGLLVLLYFATLLQRMRLRVTEIDRRT